MKKEQSKAIGPIIGISLAILGFLIWLIYFKTPGETDAEWFAKLPAVNASLNALSACFLSFGLLAIKRGLKKAHIAMMVSATLSSSLFLICYIIYHNYQGDTRFLAEGFIRPIYFFILITHILLSMVVVPLVLLTLWLAISKQFTSHKKIAHWTFPIWLYVSVTGILVYLILHNFNAA
ncbi:MAG: hypothetical protein CMI18_04035 [Opitutaceae bacterium]|nr:hypothetical protein [Opitutaceae bacterium]